MKFITAIPVLALAATTVLANPAPEANPEPQWCRRPGQSCWKVKRAADAFVESLNSTGEVTEPSAESDLSNLPGGAAYDAKRALNELAAIIGETTANAVEYYGELELHRYFHPDTNAADADVIERREAAPEPQWCRRPGQSCWKRDNTGSADKAWCNSDNNACAKVKAAAEAVLAAVGDDTENLAEKPFEPVLFSKREAAPEPQWCRRPGQSCWKRDVDSAVIEAREAAPEPQWCRRPGQSCWKAKRDLAAMRAVARDVLDFIA